MDPQVILRQFSEHEHNNLGCGLILKAMPFFMTDPYPHNYPQRVITSAVEGSLPLAMLHIVFSMWIFFRIIKTVPKFVAVE